MSDRIKALGLDKAPNDTVKFRLLSAIRCFARDIGDKILLDEANSMMPLAHPYKPTEAWSNYYYEGFTSEIDKSTRSPVYVMETSAVMFWQYLTDKERESRLQNPQAGIEDGINDVRQLNAWDQEDDALMAQKNESEREQ